MKKVIFISFVLLILIIPVVGTFGAETIPEAGVVTLEMLNPLAMLEIKRTAPAPRVTDLNNKRVLLYWNGKLNSDVAVQRVRELFEKRFTGQEFKVFKGIATFVALPKEMVNEIVNWKPDIIVASTAD